MRYCDEPYGSQPPKNDDEAVKGLNQLPGAPTSEADIKVDAPSEQTIDKIFDDLGNGIPYTSKDYDAFQKAKAQLSAAVDQIIGDSWDSMHCVACKIVQENIDEQHARKARFFNEGGV